MASLLLAVIYVAFISLGLPDPLLGSAWPSMYKDFGVDISFAGIIAMIIASGTVFSSLMSDWFTKKAGVGKVMVISVATTALALFGFSISTSFWMLCIWAIPYGLGAGSVDAALNNYVALNYKSRHMSWLHCMWGVGTAIGPSIMGFALAGQHGWNYGYRYIAIFQTALTVILVASVPLWKKNKAQSDLHESEKNERPLSLRQIFLIPGAKEVMIAFFCYSTLEQTTGLWAGSYLALYENVSPEKAAFFEGMFYIGITAGRAISGFLTMKMNDTQMIRLGQIFALAGVVAVILPFGQISTIGGLVTIGLGCAPIYPCIIHSTPAHFGADKSQAIIGIQMASAYTGTTLMPPLFGMIASKTTIALYPFCLLLALVLLFIMHEKLVKKTSEV